MCHPKSLNSLVSDTEKADGQCRGLIQVAMAEPYRPGAMQPGGDAKNMLIMQYRFPEIYDCNLEQVITASLFQCLMKDYKDTLRQVLSLTKIHVGSQKGAYKLEDWFFSTSYEGILAFCVDILKTNFKNHWTGFRIMGSVSQNGDAEWEIQLFSKSPRSLTEVYTGHKAPNVLPGARNNQSQD